MIIWTKVVYLDCCKIFRSLHKSLMTLFSAMYRVSHLFLAFWGEIADIRLVKLIVFLRRTATHMWFVWCQKHKNQTTRLLLAFLHIKKMLKLFSWGKISKSIHMTSITNHSLWNNQTSWVKIIKCNKTADVVQLYAED